MLISSSVQKCYVNYGVYTVEKHVRMLVPCRILEFFFVKYPKQERLKIPPSGNAFSRLLYISK